MTFRGISLNNVIFSNVVLPGVPGGDANETLYRDLSMNGGGSLSYSTVGVLTVFPTVIL